MNFFAIDFETANSNYSSICQIGLAEFQNSKLHRYWLTNINPEDYFDSYNISIHGITEEDVKDAPTFDQVYDDLRSILDGRITVHHTSFDRVAFKRACEVYGISDIENIWLDSSLIVKRTWQEFSKKGYGLSNLSEALKIKFNHHNALEDAIVSGIVTQKACQASGIIVDEWVSLLRSRRRRTYYEGSLENAIKKQTINEDGIFYGKNLVMTGNFAVRKADYVEIANQVGCEVRPTVTKETNIVVVGYQKESSLRGKTKSSKHLKAEKLKKDNRDIIIITEKDFLAYAKEYIPDNIQCQEENPIEEIIKTKRTNAINVEKNFSEWIEPEEPTFVSIDNNPLKFSIVSDSKRNKLRILLNDFLNEEVFEYPSEIVDDIVYSLHQTIKQPDYILECIEYLNECKSDIINGIEDFQEDENTDYSKINSELSKIVQDLISKLSKI